MMINGRPAISGVVDLPPGAYVEVTLPSGRVEALRPVLKASGGPMSIGWYEDGIHIYHPHGPSENGFFTMGGEKHALSMRFTIDAPPHDAPLRLHYTIIEIA